ncbi:hypothetical protein F5Y07DRAFT_217199 [Xylaria sp. FL0933]|nr:hypothetical protein F5Y07DRAFT_217199 [Xylaria sp. FL0933]
MDRIPAKLYPKSDQDKCLHVAYKDRWERLKPIIVELYLGPYGVGDKTMTLDQIVEFMRAIYSFHAAVTEYRHRLRAWGISKRVTKNMKDGALYALAKRKRTTTSTSQVTVTHDGRDQQLPPRKLIRHLKEQQRQRQVLGIIPGLLSSWNLPYKAFIASMFRNEDRPSPFEPLGATPECLNIKSPTPVTPSREMAAPSPNMQLVYRKAKIDRATLFLEGRLEHLVNDMCREDRKLFVNYFHDFYMKGFVMAKNWGQILPNWPSVVSSLDSPQGRAIETPSHSSNLALSPSSLEFLNLPDVSKAPTQLCYWSIHLPRPKGDAYCTDDTAEQPQEQPPPPSFLADLRESLLCSNFTSLSSEELPIAQDVVVNAIMDDRRALDTDAWKLAIMAGNWELLYSLFDENDNEVPDGIEDIHPFHLAGSFLNGGRACCTVFEVLLNLLRPEYPFRHRFDGHGHTILDTLIVSILRSHTKVDPASVSYAFRSPNRFPGEEMDICSRWSPDAQIVRDLFKDGVFRIPHSWKHPFCHTAVQAICHAIIAVYTPACAPNINDMSGLFIRRCTECGRELRLGPLHTLVVTTFYLAQSGMEGENLFGAISVLVCLLSLGADVTITANISVEGILDASEMVQCRHIDLSPIELMNRVPKEVIDTWADDCKVGWSCFAQLLSHSTRHTRNSQAGVDSDDDRGDQSDEDYGDTSAMRVSDAPSENVCHFNQIAEHVHDGWLNLKCHDEDMGLLWATIQTELLTYRRINEGDSWISANFSLRALETWLSGKSAQFLTPLVNERMMMAHSKCGWFYNAECFVIPAAQEVSAHYFMNMDIYRRATYLDVPYLLKLWERLQPLDKEST